MLHYALSSYVVLVASWLQVATAETHAAVALDSKSNMRLMRSTIKEDDSMEVFDSGVELPGLEKVHFEPAFFQKCVSKWQTQCRAHLAKDPSTEDMLCEKHLDRGYLKGRLLVPQEHVRAHFNGPSVLDRNKTIYEGQRLPKYTEEGYKKSRVPAELHERIVKWFRENRKSATPEEAPVTGKWCNNDYDNDDFVLPWNEFEGIKELRDLLTSELSEWTQEELAENPIVYGVRMYHRGSICALHTDESADHIISAIYHLDERGLDSEWPLDVVDHGGNARSITSQPGDLIFYESASLPHGRKGTLKGDEFANIFFHFKPKGWLKAKEAAYESMMPWNQHFKYVAPELTPAIFHTDDKCLPMGTGDAFSGAFNTTVMQLAVNYDGSQGQHEPTQNVGNSLLETQGLDEVAKRMMYWRKADIVEETKADLMKTPPTDTKYMLFDIDAGGLNNIRLGWEMAGLVALHTGRTLVLPHSMQWYLIDEGPGVESSGSTSLIEDFINVPQLQRGLSVMTFGEFAAKHFPEFTFAASTREAYEDFASKHTTKVLSSCDIDAYSVKDQMIYVHDDDPKGNRLFTCSTWAEIGQPRFTQGGKPWTLPATHHALLQEHFVWHPEIFQLASHVVNSLGLFNYVAVHARYNDFQFKEDREPPQAIVDRWASHFDRWLGKGDTIYISTDSSHPEEFVKAVQKSMKRPMKVKLAADMFEDAKSPIAELLEDMSSKRIQELKGPIEQVICSFAKVFVGTEKSTFSGYIERMRSYADAPQHVLESSVEKTILVHTQDPSPELIANVDTQLTQAPTPRPGALDKEAWMRSVKLHSQGQGQGQESYSDTSGVGKIGKFLMGVWHGAGE